METKEKSYDLAASLFYIVPLSGFVGMMYVLIVRQIGFDLSILFALFIASLFLLFVITKVHANIIKKVPHYDYAGKAITWSVFFLVESGKFIYPLLRPDVEMEGINFTLSIWYMTGAPWVISYLFLQWHLRFPIAYSLLPVAGWYTYYAYDAALKAGQI